MVPCSLIWCDQDKQHFEQISQSVELENNFIDEVKFDHCHDLAAAHELINSSAKAVLIVSGQLGSQLLPQLQGGLKPIPNVTGVIVFCSNIQIHRSWAKNFPLVKMVTDDINQVLACSKQLI